MERIARTRMRMDVPTMLLLAGLNIAFFVALLGNSVALRGEATGLYTTRFKLLAYGLILASAFLTLLETHGGIIWKQRSYRVWLVLFFWLLLIMAMRSYIGEAGLSSLVIDTFTYLLVVVIFLRQGDIFWKLLTQVLVFHSVLAVAYGLWILSSFTMSSFSPSEMRGAVFDSDITQFYSLLYGIPFLLFTYPALSGWARVVTISGVLIYIITPILGQSRGAFLVSLLTFVLAGFVWWRAKQAMVIRRRVVANLMMAGVLLVGVGLVVWYGGWERRIGLADSLESLVNRSIGEETVLETSLSDYRFFETIVVASVMTWDQWLLGTGVSGTWSHPSAFDGEERTMVHIGYMNLVFKGGISLLLLFLFFPLGIGWRAFFTSHDLWTLAAGAMMVRYSVSLFYAGFLGPDPGVVLFFLCAGRLAASTARQPAY